MTGSTPFRNPFADDPAFAAARKLVVSGGLGQLLAVYAVARAKDPLPDPLATLGLPLLEEIIGALGEQPNAVTAVRTGESGGFAHWSLVIAFPSGVRATIDLGSGVGAAQAAALDLRVEWSGTERVILVDPANVAVAVSSERGVHHRSAEVSPIADRLFAPADPLPPVYRYPLPAWQYARLVVAAARESAETGTPTLVS